VAKAECAVHPPGADASPSSIASVRRRLPLGWSRFGRGTDGIYGGRVPVVRERDGVDLVGLVAAYCRRVGPAVLEQHEGDSVSSPLGIWLLLAACAVGASGQQRAEIEEAVGCSAPQAAHLLLRFLEAPPPALHTALALWVREADVTPALSEWSATLPPEVERGGIPSQAEADSWAGRHTYGLIKRFPTRITQLTRILLTSALATKVSWDTPFSVAPAREQLPASSPWLRQVGQVLVDTEPGPLTFLAVTEPAGVVAVHVAQAVEDLAVMSVSADPSVDRVQVFEAAYDLASRCRSDDMGAVRCSMFDLPLGPGHSWSISEREVAANSPDERTERVVRAVLPAWKTNSSLDLKASPLFGAGAAVSALLALIGAHPGGDETEAVQSATASYTPEGFEAAAVTTVGIRAMALIVPEVKGLERRAQLNFDHPYAAIALSGGAHDFRDLGAAHPDDFCLPLFAAWVNTPVEPESASD
jgi:hypothetical protein